MNTETIYRVFTANPDYMPQLAIYEVERGEFNALADARVLANELAEAGEASEIVACQWVLFKKPCVFTSAK